MPLVLCLICDPHSGHSGFIGLAPSAELWIRVLFKSIILKHICILGSKFQRMAENLYEKLKALFQLNLEHIARLPAEDDHSAFRQDGREFFADDRVIY